MNTDQDNSMKQRPLIKPRSSGPREFVADDGHASQIKSQWNLVRIASVGPDATIDSSGNDARIAAAGMNPAITSSGPHARIACAGHGSNVVASGATPFIALSGQASKVTVTSPGAKVATARDENEIEVGENAVVVCAMNPRRFKLGLYSSICIHDGVQFYIAHAGREFGVNEWSALREGRFVRLFNGGSDALG